MSASGVSWSRPALLAHSLVRVVASMRATRPCDGGYNCPAGEHVIGCFRSTPEPEPAGDPSDFIAVMRAHMADHPDGVRGDCCANVALDYALRALDRDEAKRQRELAAALAPWRET